MSASTTSPLARKTVAVEGVVQGVGFRPAVARLARSLSLAGMVRNDGAGVLIEVEGPPADVERFVAALPAWSPPHARIDRIVTGDDAPRGTDGFVVAVSGAPRAAFAVAVPADLGPCAACTRELLAPSGRRRRHAFIACTACGPRFSVLEKLPYDRTTTTMAPFHLCAACLNEYRDIEDRRFHAEATSCPTCGPTLRLRRLGEDVARDDDDDDALAAAVRLLRDGRIVAVKGVGGYALACDATSEDAVRRLRERKRRPHKPLAVMARDLDVARAAAVLDDDACALLASPARPIVVAPAAEGSPLCASVHPGLVEVGVFLPPSPLQLLLAAEGPAWLVMTSGNASGAPIARDDDEAERTLAGIADALLVHDRRIVRRLDDSVVRVSARGTIPVRRARGVVPDAVPLPRTLRDAPPVLAVGGDDKSTVCVAGGGRAVLSAHLGSLRHTAAQRSFVEAVADLRALLAVDVVAVAHDLHPDYASTRFAAAHAAETGAALAPVAHHHAHVAACLAEHGRDERVLGVVFDGTGLGVDGTLWGGEVLEADLLSFRRLAHLRPLALPGGEAAIATPWRLALSAVVDAGEGEALLARIDEGERRRVRAILEHRVACPTSTGAGRWFDAVSALCGLCDEASFDGQAAMLLEQAAARAPAVVVPWPVDPGCAGGDDAPAEIDARALVRAACRDLRGGVDVATVAARFHETLARIIAGVCAHARDRGAPCVVALTGGCFQNRRLLERSAALLEERGFEVLAHARVPPNDGGLSLGQAAVAAARSCAGR